ncbi:MaoC family dehydratase [Aminithiophilus ramosus]|uniref:MaoC family dehydratase n=1 Tax=Aminithiophilus ramosus TaxID=3029084 RepID=A0A9Q7AH76_9BACT|nr:MaoC family dehydratase [Aminithiophilus ramosus]QTX31895.1 MaoC family dehydratase [Aminithiophilus ramosus]
MNSPDFFGKYLEEYSIGQIFKHWPGKTVTEGDNNLFCLLTMNHHPIHLDSHYAARSQHGRPLVVGTYVFSLVVGLTVRDISGKAIANLEYESIIHHAPVFIGDTLYAETEIIDVKKSRTKLDRGIIYVETSAFNQKGIKVLSFRRKVLIPTKGGEKCD